MRHRRVAGLAGAQAELGVVPLDEHGQRQPDLADHLGRDQAHPPAVVVDVDAAVQPRGRPQRLAGEVVPVHGRRRRAPEPAVLRDGLTVGVHHGAVVEAEHLPTDEDRAAWPGRRTPPRAGCPRARTRRRRRAAGRSRRSRRWTASFMAREKPPEPPRLGCSMTRSSVAQRLGRRGEAGLVVTTFWVPWSTTTISSMISSTSRSSDRLSSWSTQKSGRLNVVMPMVTVPGVSAVGLEPTTRPPRGSSSPSPASTSNQYQPPSMNGLSGRSNSNVCRLVGVDGDRARPAARAPWRWSGRR